MDALTSTQKSELSSIFSKVASSSISSEGKEDLVITYKEVRRGGLGHERTIKQDKGRMIDGGGGGGG